METEEILELVEKLNDYVNKKGLNALEKTTLFDVLLDNSKQEREELLFGSEEDLEEEDDLDDELESEEETDDSEYIEDEMELLDKIPKQVEQEYKERVKPKKLIRSFEEEQRTANKELIAKKKAILKRPAIKIKPKEE